GTRVGCKAALKDHDCFGVLELRKPPFELHVDLHRTGDRADGSGADTEAANRLNRTLPQLRVCREAEVVVRRQVDDVPVVNESRRLLLVIKDPETPVQALFLERVELGGEVTERIATRGHRRRLNRGSDWSVQYMANSRHPARTLRSLGPTGIGASPGKLTG